MAEHSTTPPPPPSNDATGGPASSPPPPPSSSPLPPPPPTAPAVGGMFAPIGYDPTMMTARPVRWGMGDAVVGLLLAQVFALIGAIVVVGALGLDFSAAEELDEALTIGWIAVLQAFLWVGYGGYPVLVSRWKGSGVVADYGWRFRGRDIWQGLLVGIGLQIVAVPALYGLLSLVFDVGDVSESAEDLVGRAEGPGVLLLALVVVVGAPIVEELFFRGLLLRSVQRRFGAWPAIIVSGVLFMAVHLEPRLFPALLLVGIVTGWVTVRSGRLGPAIWIHVGFNAVTIVALVALT